MMSRKKIQAKHIPERLVLLAIHAVCMTPPRLPATHWEAGGVISMSEYAPSLAKVPEKVLLAKLRILKKRGLVDGCACGCRGDWTLTDKGRAAIAVNS